MPSSIPQQLCRVMLLLSMLLLLIVIGHDGNVAADACGEYDDGYACRNDGYDCCWDGSACYDC